MLQSLRSKLFTAERLGPEQPAGLDGTGLLEAIVCETQTAALHSAVITSALTALQSGHIRGPQVLKDFVPGQSAVIGELLRSHEEAGLDAETTLNVKALFSELGPARSSMERLIADAARLGGDSANLNYGTALAQWSTVCQRAQAALVALDDSLHASLPDYYGCNSSMLLKLLKGAVEGRQPCIDAAGQPFLPDMPQRRRTARRSLLQQVLLRYRGKTAPVIAKDISITGLGLERTPELKPQELVQIELNGGRRLIGLVVWAKGGSAGVRLGKPLPPNDPLLIG